MFRSLCLLLLLAVAPLAAAIDVEDLTRHADRVVVARVSDVHAQFVTTEQGDQRIESTVVLDVLETVKGAHAPVLTIRIEGGTVGDLTMTVSDVPLLQRGMRAVFFLGGSRGRVILPIGRDNQVEGRSVASLTAEIRGVRP